MRRMGTTGAAAARLRPLLPGAQTPAQAGASLGALLTRRAAGCARLIFIIECGNRQQNEEDLALTRLVAEALPRRARACVRARTVVNTQLTSSRVCTHH